MGTDWQRGWLEPFPVQDGRKYNKTDKLCEAICRYVAENGLSPGDSLPNEQGLAEMFGSSRSVVRDAVSRLRGAGLLDSRPRAGVRVADCRLSDALRYQFAALASDTDTVEKLYEMRVAVDCGAALLVVGRVSYQQIAELHEIAEKMGSAKELDGMLDLDTAFHLKMLEFTGNPFLADLGGLVVRFFNQARQCIPDRITPALRAENVRDHEAIVDALSQRSRTEVLRTMQKHYGGQEIREILRRNGKRQRRRRSQESAR